MIKNNTLRRLVAITVIFIMTWSTLVPAALNEFEIDAPTTPYVEAGTEPSSEGPTDPTNGYDLPTEDIGTPPTDEEYPTYPTDEEYPTYPSYPTPPTDEEGSDYYEECVCEYEDCDCDCEYGAYVEPPVVAVPPVIMVPALIISASTDIPVTFNAERTPGDGGAFVGQNPPPAHLRNIPEGMPVEQFLLLHEPLPTLLRPGYVLWRWETADGTVLDETTVVTAPTTFYPAWGHELLFFPNWNDVPGITHRIRVGAGMSADEAGVAWPYGAIGPARPGATFVGWSREQIGGINPSIPTGMEVDQYTAINQSGDLFAIWQTPAVHTVTFVPGTHGTLAAGHTATREQYHLHSIAQSWQATSGILNGLERLNQDVGPNQTWGASAPMVTPNSGVTFEGWWLTPNGWQTAADAAPATTNHRWAHPGGAATNATTPLNWTAANNTASAFIAHPDFTSGEVQQGGGDGLGYVYANWVYRVTFNPNLPAGAGTATGANGLSALNSRRDLPAGQNLPISEGITFLPANNANTITEWSTRGIPTLPNENFTTGTGDAAINWVFGGWFTTQAHAAHTFTGVRDSELADTTVITGNTTAFALWLPTFTVATSFNHTSLRDTATTTFIPGTTVITRVIDGSPVTVNPTDRLPWGTQVNVTFTPAAEINSILHPRAAAPWNVTGSALNTATATENTLTGLTITANTIVRVDFTPLAWPTVTYRATSGTNAAPNPSPGTVSGTVIWPTVGATAQPFASGTIVPAGSIVTITLAHDNPAFNLNINPFTGWQVADNATVGNPAANTVNNTFTHTVGAGNTWLNAIHTPVSSPIVNFRATPGQIAGIFATVRLPGTSNWVPSNEVVSGTGFPIGTEIRFRAEYSDPSQFGPATEPFQGWTVAIGSGDNLAQAGINFNATDVNDPDTWPLQLTVGAAGLNVIAWFEMNYYVADMQQRPPSPGGTHPGNIWQSDTHGRVTVYFDPASASSPNALTTTVRQPGSLYEGALTNMRTVHGSAITSTVNPANVHANYRFTGWRITQTRVTLPCDICDECIASNPSGCTDPQTPAGFEPILIENPDILSTIPGHVLRYFDIPGSSPNIRTSNMDIAATFERINLRILTSVAPANGGSINVTDNLPLTGLVRDNQRTLTAVANEGFEFVNWTVTGLPAGHTTNLNLAELPLTIVDQDITAVANFVSTLRNVDARINASDMPNNLNTHTLNGSTITRTPGRTVSLGQTVTIELTQLAQGYNFTGWDVSPSYAQVDFEANSLAPNGRIIVTTEANINTITVQANIAPSQHTVTFHAGHGPWNATWTNVVGMGADHVGLINAGASQQRTVAHGFSLGNNNQMPRVINNPPLGFVFAGWFTYDEMPYGANLFTHNTIINGNVDLYARWLPAYNVTFERNLATATLGNARHSHFSPLAVAQGFNLEQMGSIWNISFMNDTTATAVAANVFNTNRYQLGGGQNENNDWRPIAPGFELVALGNGRWNTSPVGFGDAFTMTTPITADTTVYAQWTVTVTFNANFTQISPGGTNPLPRTVSGLVVGRSFNTNGLNNSPHNIGADSFPTVEAASNVPGYWDVLSNAPIGWTFGGWNTAADGTGTPFTINTIIEEATTVYALWTSEILFLPGTAPDSVIPDTHRTRLVPAGGFPGQPLNAINQPGRTDGLYFPPNPVWEYGDFEAWNTRSDGTGLTVQRDQNPQHLFSSPTVLHAIWSVTLTFNPNGGAMTSLSNHWNHPTTTGSAIREFVFINAGVPIRAGYNFVEWNTEPDGTGIPFATGSPILRNTTVYAQWSLRTVRVDFDGTYGVVLSENEYRVLPENSNLAAGNLWPPIPTREGHEFMGWTINQDGSGGNFTATTNVPDNITVYAQWRPFVRVTFDGNGGTVELANRYRYTTVNGTLNGALGAISQMPTAIPTRANYTFTGWQTAAGEAFTSAYQVPANMYVYAQWTATPVTVTFIGNGGIVLAENESRTLQQGSTLGGQMPTAIPTRANYTFTGWQTEAGVVFTADYVVNDDMYVYAQWTATLVTVTFIGNGGIVLAENESRTLQQGSTLGGQMPTAIPTRANYTFSAWNTMADGMGSAFNASTVVLHDINVYAIWTSGGDNGDNGNGGPLPTPEPPSNGDNGTNGSNGSDEPTTTPTPPSNGDNGNGGPGNGNGDPGNGNGDNGNGNGGPGNGNGENGNGENGNGGNGNGENGNGNGDNGNGNGDNGDITIPDEDDWYDDDDNPWYEGLYVEDLVNMGFTPDQFLGAPSSPFHSAPFRGDLTADELIDLGFNPGDFRNNVGNPFMGPGFNPQTGDDMNIGAVVASLTGLVISSVVVVFAVKKHKKANA